MSMKPNHVTALAIGGGVTVAYVLYRVIRNRKRPPGPCGLPIVGNLLSLMAGSQDCLPLKFSQWADTYGPIYIIRLGRLDAVVINTMDLVEQVMVTRATGFSGRPSCLPLIKLIYDGRGLTWKQGQDWKNLRQLCSRALHPGTNDSANDALEDIVQCEMSKLLNEMSKKFEASSEPQDPSCILHQAVTNIICYIIFGTRYKYGSRQLQDLIQLVATNLHFCNIFNETNLIKLMAQKCRSAGGEKMDKCSPGPKTREPRECPNGADDEISESLTYTMTNTERLLALIGDEIERHESTYNPNELRDFVDQYLKTTDGGRIGNKASVICRQDAEAAIIDMLTFGTKPCSAILRWAILCLIVHPEVQAKCHEELDRVIGCGRTVNLSDEPCLPYIVATLMEVNRRYTVMPLSLPHQSKCTTTLCEYEIPGDTVVICNQRAIHMNEHYWTDPCAFSPERFLDPCTEDGSTRVSTSHEAYIPFGMGPRQCPGDDLANKITFLMFAGLLQRYEFAKACECSDYSCFLQGTFDVVYTPQAYTVRFNSH